LGFEMSGDRGARSTFPTLSDHFDDRFQSHWFSVTDAEENAEG